MRERLIVKGKDVTTDPQWSRTLQFARIIAEEVNVHEVVTQDYNYETDLGFPEHVFKHVEQTPNM